VTERKDPGADKGATLDRKNNPGHKDMYLKEIEIRTEKLSGWSTLNIVSTGCVGHLYLRRIPGILNTGPIGKINVYLSPEPGIKVNTPAVEVLDCFIYFDMERMKVLMADKKKKCLLDIVQQALHFCAGELGWDHDPLLDAYNAVLADGLDDTWWWGGKIKASKSRKYAAGIFCRYDLDGYEAWMVLFDGKKNELGRSLIFKDKYLSFDFDFFKWHENESALLYKFRPPQKQFSIPLDDINAGSGLTRYVDINIFFKK
jgi:hypothetical protein